MARRMRTGATTGMRGTVEGSLAGSTGMGYTP